MELRLSPERGVPCGTSPPPTDRVLQPAGRRAVRRLVPHPRARRHPGPARRGDAGGAVGPRGRGGLLLQRAELRGRRQQPAVVAGRQPGARAAARARAAGAPLLARPLPAAGAPVLLLRALHRRAHQDAGGLDQGKPDWSATVSRPLAAGSACSALQ